MSEVRNKEAPSTQRTIQVCTVGLHQKLAN